jgi:2-hydroxychromene-2-carboxylate isomerase
MPFSIKRLLMPTIAARLLSRERLLKKRQRAEATRVARGERHRVHYFHQVDDPYGALCAQALPRLRERYDIQIEPHVVGAPPDAAAPERDKLIAYSRKDAERLARRFGLAFRDAGAQPPAADVELATRQLVAATRADRFVDDAAKVSAWLWRAAVAPAPRSGSRATSGSATTTASMSASPSLPPPALAAATAAEAAEHIADAEALRARLGHYLGATFFYGGEWYWGLDRLHHLEQRLQDLGAQHAGVSGLLYPPGADLREPLLQPAAGARLPPIDFFLSLRSPYTAIVAERVLALGQLAGAPVRLRYVLPMVMRGLPVPPIKRKYIREDAAREAFVRGIPFGRVNDPLGRPTERGLALLAFAERTGRGPAFLLSFLRGVWAEGIDAGSDRGLRKIAERAGLPWQEARAALADVGWRRAAERNRAEMFALGLWGVPSFRVGEVAVWGQDRLWVVQEALQRLATNRAA